MKTKDFYFELPEELIAQHPPAQRGQSRLLVYDRKKDDLIDSFVGDLPQHLVAGTQLFFNDTKVRKARVFVARETSQGVVRSGELVLLEPLPSNSTGTHEAELDDSQNKSFKNWYCIAGGLGRIRPADRFYLVKNQNITGSFVSRQNGQWEVEFDQSVSDQDLEQLGHIPLPPYIQRPDQAFDAERYQTVYSKAIGSAAAPTAGLHFTPKLLDELKQAGMGIHMITLHVGLGTFLPVRTESIEDHAMHRERYYLSSQVIQALQDAKNRNQPIIPVGTTSLRAIESAAKQERGLVEGWSSTNIFIYPGYQFKLTSGLFTNFHTPESTLLMLVSAFSSREQMLEIYNEAVKRRYRFFSYGDAMLIK